MHPATVGPYQIERELGRGGMGEVYLARDTRLERQVAIKALPAHLAQDPDRLARFQREAKVLASLNHRGIGAIYGLEEADGHQYLILEFVEGETLSERLGSGAIPVDESLSIAKQIAEALELAHEKGIIHRDLKPDNVMITPDGVVKVLDFGLARTADGAPSSTNSPRAAESPTLPVRSPTVPGAIMGTAGYMSPEQARGKPVDKRSDIFSFGCVLYEMLTGAGPFPGETVTDSLGAILHREPEWTLLPPNTPPRVRELLLKCLAKDRRNRLNDIGDARLEIERTLAGHEWTTIAAPATAAKRNWLLPAGLVVAAAAIAGGAGWLLASRYTQAAAPTPRQTLHLGTNVDRKPSFNTLLAIAPDSKFLIYTASQELPADSTKPTGILVVRRLDRDETSVIENSEGARDGALSPDGRWIVYSCSKDRGNTKQTLKKIALENGRPTGKPETICELPAGNPPVLAWASDREIVFSPNYESVVYLVSASGGEPREVLREDRPKGIESWADFRPLVPGKSFLATRWSFVGQKVKVNTEVIDLTTKKRTTVLPDAGGAQYIADANGGYLVAMRANQTSLIAVRFDPTALRTIGDPVTVWSGNPINTFRVAADGTLAVTTRPLEVVDRRLAWLDEKGLPQPIAGMSRSYGDVSISPDGGRVLAFQDISGNTDLINEVWVQDLSRRTSTRIPIQGAMLGMLWSPGGQKFVYGLARDDQFCIMQRSVDGSGEPVKLFSSPDSRTLLFPGNWSPDGKTLAFLQIDMATDNSDAYLLTQEQGTDKWVPKPYLTSPVPEDLSGFSPDGKYVLIGSTQSGRRELYLQRFTGDGAADAKAGRVQISTGGGGIAWWSPDGKEIRYQDPDGQILSVQVKTEPTISATEPKLLYSVKDLKTRSSTFGPDGRMMVVLQGESEQTTAAVGVVINFLDEVRAKVPATK